ncbi:MAG: Carbamoyl-phosphate synthase, large subunit [Candidatus Peregrinibacteria bacterium GW2011_GWA2_33_10]|nr:MAG: Carbamoyl-phosphate synthase, large subunit [Candidatus Peregrinibacteria bacterium GW2011_GWA2_33_10]KKP41019.1 MAG: carbamoyl-phosphate synthase large subunit, carbamoyl-phosphate synthase large subunit [Candidatus Peregrinibacteria bacterium GW2011_GWC2_33_13]
MSFLTKQNLEKVKKVLILGSGALKIGEAGEFDYSGSQAIKALKEEKIKTILINPNIATNQTSKGLADKIYFLPVNTYFVEKVIEKEKPDGLLLAFGGQTALNCGIELWKQGILKKHKIKVLGTSVETIEKTEDRELFNKELQKINVLTPTSFACRNKKDAFLAAEKIKYPVIIRAAFALGGKGSGFASNKEELEKLLDTAFAFSPQVLVEENLKGWKEIEYEVVRDKYDNCITVCNMENFDPLGVHTGESIVIAPSQTLTNKEYHYLREISIKTIRHFQIVGECNIQFALDPNSLDYRVIEVNARLSRSSALASKATGYPLAFIAAKLALGYSLPNLPNAVTKKTTACFEPALDYLALKIPRWDLDKFRKVSQEITSEMKSVGEIMALGRSFEEVMQKGLRMLQVGLHGFTGNERLGIKSEKLQKEIEVPTPKRILAIYEALKKGWSPEKISKMCGIDKWFLDKLKNIVEVEKKLSNAKTIGRDLLLEAKKSGFSDHQIAKLKNKKAFDIRALRNKLKVLPVVKQIDTLAAEYPAETNYLYLTYHGEKDDIDFKSKKKKAIVLGSGAYCIGSSVEFDWCCVNAIKTLGKEGYETIMINYNPETVSTDYDMCDKLYFDELSLERVYDIYEKENPHGLVLSTGGQIPNNLALKLLNLNVNVLGTSPESIDKAEDRHKFSAMLDKLEIDQPKWKDFAEEKHACKFAKDVGYPVLVRPSYVLSGAAMRVAQNEEDLKNYLAKAAKISKVAPVVISKFEKGAKEIEIDAVAHKGELIIWAIAEHIENAGVHSGDATIVLPPQKLYLETIRRIKKITKQVAEKLNITGPFNIQFLAKNNRVMVIECNLRASRSFPFSSKVTGNNFIEIAVEAMLGKVKPKKYRKEHYRTLDLDHVGVKAPQFSFSRLKGADPVLGVEMASTGEVACFGENLEEAFLKSMISVGFRFPQKNILLSIGTIEDKADFLSSAQKLITMGFNLYATEGTADFLKENGVANTRVYKADKPQKENNILSLMQGKKVDFVINIPKNYSHEEITQGYIIRRHAIDLNIPLITNVQVAKLIVESIMKYKLSDLEIQDWEYYL